MSAQSPSSTPEEFADLRRRVYGPASEFTAEQAVLLQGLEERVVMERAASLLPSTGAGDSPPRAPSAEHRAAGESPPVATEGVVLDVVGGDPPRERLATGGRWLWAAGGGAVGAALVAGAWALSAPPPGVALDSVAPDVETTGLPVVPSETPPDTGSSSTAPAAGSGFSAVDPRIGPGLPPGSAVSYTWESESGLQGWVAVIEGETRTGSY
ncbi:hypothetical protein [Microbacterium xanthum]|uniref:hypothetical protein n=1 Tax=Microbacterium xanthum TaxID=3079794 RepID=UPI002AD49D18|nr:hypothetical protein [Microbacterium sp. KSW-48]MDZ8172288.1 hypothetical protein [Microbacterium sp. KSW-48]